MRGGERRMFWKRLEKKHPAPIALSRMQDEAQTDTVVVSLRQRVKREILENLLAAHESAAKQGYTTGLIELSNYLFQILKDPDYNIQDLVLIKSEYSHNDPPKNRED